MTIALKNTSTNEKSFLKNRDILHVYWTLTSFCNYSCNYCLQDKDKHTIDLIDREQILSIAHTIISTPHAYYAITISGGEPTLHPYFFDIIQYLYTSKKNIGLIVETNGSRSLDWFKKLVMAIPAQSLQLNLSIHPEFSSLEHILSLIALTAESHQRAHVCLMHDFSQKDAVRTWSDALLSLRTVVPFTLEICSQQTAKDIEHIGSHYTNDDLLWGVAASKAFAQSAENGPAQAKPLPFTAPHFTIHEGLVQPCTHKPKRNSPVFKNFFCVTGTKLIRIDNRGQFFGACCNEVQPFTNIVVSTVDKQQKMVQLVQCQAEVCPNAINNVLPKFRYRHRAEQYVVQYNNRMIAKSFNTSPLLHPSDGYLTPHDEVRVRLARLQPADIEKSLSFFGSDKAAPLVKAAHEAAPPFPNWMIHNFHKVCAIYNSLADEQSKDVFLRVIKSLSVDTVNYLPTKLQDEDDTAYLNDESGALFFIEETQPDYYKIYWNDGLEKNDRLKNLGHDFTRCETVPFATAFDDFLAQHHTRCTALRINCPTNTLSFLRGAQDSIAYYQPTLHISVGKKDTLDLDTMLFCISSYSNYCMFSLVSNSSEEVDAWLLCQPYSTHDQYIERQEQESVPTLSIIVFSQDDEQEKLHLTLDTLLTHPSNSIEVLIIGSCGGAEYTTLVEPYIKSNPNTVNYTKLNNTTTWAARRNLSLLLAKGSYVAFIDQGEVISSGFVQSTLETIALHKPDVIIYNTMSVLNDGTTERSGPYPESNTPLEDYINGDFSGYMSDNMLYSTAFLKKNKLVYYDVQPLSRLLFTIQTLFYAQNIHIQNMIGIYIFATPNGSCAKPINENASSLATLAFLLHHIAIFLKTNRICLNDTTKKRLFAHILSIFWPIIILEMKRYEEDGKLDKLLTEDVLSKIGYTREALHWIFSKHIAHYYMQNSMQPSVAAALDWRQEAFLPAPQQDYREYMPSLQEMPRSPVLSVIIPNYNKEQYLKDCMDSVLSQSFTDFEVIIVDDASTDNSFTILKDYAAADARIRLFRMETNCMQGVCRNIGIEKATGKYIIFVDSDDYVNPGFFEMALADILKEQADIVIYATQEIDTHGRVIRKLPTKPMSAGGVAACSAFWSDTFPWGPWGKILSRAFITNNNICFAEYIYHQDVFFLSKALYLSTKSVTCEQVVYSTRLTPGSSIRPARYRYTHIKSAIAKIQLRDHEWKSGHTNLPWEYMAKAQRYSYQNRLLPALTHFWNATNAVAIADEDMALLEKNTTFLYCLLTHSLHTGTTPKPSPEGALVQSTTPERVAQLERIHAKGKLFALPPHRRLQEASTTVLSDLLWSIDTEQKQILFLRMSGLFDVSYYKYMYPDMRDETVDSVVHYVCNCRAEQFRNPAPWFNTQRYLQAYPDVAQGDLNPFIHYIVYGFAEGRNPNPSSENGTFPKTTSCCDELEELYAAPVPPRSVLLMEPNKCHGEVIPGYVKYFLDLGYHVDVIILPSQAAKAPLCRLQHSNLRIFSLHFYEVGNVIQSRHVEKYDLLFITSYTMYRWLKDCKSPSVFDHFPRLQNAKNGTLCVVHHYELLDTNKLPVERAITLDTIAGSASTVVNPHYFGKVKITSKSTTKTHFIVIGAIDETNRRNFSLLSEAVAQLHQAGVHNLFITVIGRGSVKVPPAISKYFDFMGEVDFPTLYGKVEDADFLLPLFDPQNPEHDRYLTTATSGSYQLIFGFRKPCVIPQKFAASKGLDDHNAIVYAENADLASGMRAALQMSTQDYTALQTQLDKSATALSQSSLGKLKDLLRCIGSAE